MTQTVKHGRTPVPSCWSFFKDGSFRHRFIYGYLTDPNNPDSFVPYDLSNLLNVQLIIEDDAGTELFRIESTDDPDPVTGDGKTIYIEPDAVQGAIEQYVHRDLPPAFTWTEGTATLWLEYVNEDRHPLMTGQALVTDLPG